MKNFYLYIVVPVVLLVVFLFTPGVGYLAAQKEIAAKITAQKQEAARKKAEEDARRKEIERKAEEDARKRQLEREQLEREKVEKRDREYQEIIQKLRDDIALYSGEAEQLQAEAKALEDELSRQRTKKETENRRTFDLAKQVELGKIDRRTAELEIQRMVDMVAQKLNASSLSAPPPPPPAAPAR